MPFRELSRDIALDGEVGFRELPREVLLDGEEKKTFGGELLKGAKRTGAGIVGLAETGAMVGTGLVGSAAGGVVGLRKMIAGESPEAATQEMGRISEALTYKPQTEWGKHFAGGAEYGMEKIAGARKFVGEKVQDVLSKSKWTKPLAPYLATAADTAVQLGIFGAGARLVKPGTVKPIGKEAMRVSPEEIRLEKGLRVEELGPGPAEPKLLPAGPKPVLTEGPDAVWVETQGKIAQGQPPRLIAPSEAQGRVAGATEPKLLDQPPDWIRGGKPKTIRKIYERPTPETAEGFKGAGQVFLDTKEGVIEVKWNSKTKRYEAEKAPAIERIAAPKEELSFTELPKEAELDKPPSPTPPAPEKMAPAHFGEVIKGKEPWEMAKKEWVSNREELEHQWNILPREQLGEIAPQITKLNYGKDRKGSFAEQHQEIVKQALFEGKPVPPEVLKDYPDLAPKPPIAEPGKVGEVAKPEKLPPGTPEEMRPTLERIKAENPEEYTKILKGNTAEMVKEWELKRLGKAKAMKQDIRASHEGRTRARPWYTGEAGFIEIPVEELRRSGKRFLEFWRPMSTLQNREQILKDRGKALGGIARVERVTNKVYDNLKALDEQGKKDIFQAMSGQKEISDLSPEHQIIARFLLRTNDLIGEMLVKRGIITVDQFNAHKGEYIRYMYLRHSLGDDARIVTKPNGKLDLSYQKHRKDLTWEQRRALGIIEDVSVAQPLGMAKALGDTVKYDYLEKLAVDPRNVWTPSVVEITGIPKEFTERGAKAQATYISRITGDKYSPVHIGRDRWIVWNEDTGTAVGPKMSIGDLVEEVNAYRKMDKQAPNTPEIQYRLNAYEEALERAKEGTKNVPEDFIQMPSSKHWGPLSGAFIRKEIARDLASFWGQEKGNIPGLSNALEKMARLDEKMTGTFKVMKVPLNLPTAVRNTVSNVVQLSMSGMRPDQIVNYGVKAIQNMLEKTPEYTQAFRNGLFKTNWSVAELGEVMSAFRKMEGDSWGKVVGGMHDLAKYYGRIDDIFKMTKYLEQREKGATVEKAIMESQKWGMDYSLADPSIKWARKHFIPFASYTYKIIPLIVESAIKRPWVIGSLMALPYAIWEASKAINSDMSESDWQKLRSTIPKEIKERGTWMLVPIKINDKWRWFDYSYFLPWGNIQGAIQAGKKGDIQGIAGQLGIGGTPLLQFVKTFAVDPLRENAPKDPFSGQPLYNELDEPILKAGKTVEFIYNTFAPSMMTRFGALGYTASIGKEDKWGRTIDVPQALGRWFGVNLIESNSKAASIAVKAKVNALKDELIKIYTDPNISGERKEKYRQRFLVEINELLEGQKK